MAICTLEVSLWSFRLSIPAKSVGIANWNWKHTLFIQPRLWQLCYLFLVIFQKLKMRWKCKWIFSLCCLCPSLLFSRRLRSCSGWRSEWTLRKPSWRRSEPWEDKSTTVNWSTETSVSLNTLNTLQRWWLWITGTAVYDYILKGLCTMNLICWNSLAATTWGKTVL